MTTILLARHGETEWNRERRWQGHADPPLNERGRGQAAELARRLAREHLAAVYASDLARARETAEIVAAPHALPVVTLRDLREVDVGSWSGLTAGECEARFPDAHARWADGGHGWAGGETYDELGGRVLAAVLRIAAAHPDDRVLVVTHGGAIRSLEAHAAGMSYAAYRLSHASVTANCGVSTLVVDGGRVRRAGSEPLD